MNIDLYPEKAQFLTGEPIVLMIEVNEAVPQNTKARLTITSLEKTVLEKSVSLDSGINTVVLEASVKEFGGYGAVVRLGLPGVGDPAAKEQHLEAYTAFDVVSDSARAIRYGFLSDFRTEDAEHQEDVSNLRKYHITMIQFYDWAYRHDELVAKEPLYRDLMGKETDLTAVKKKIEACHSYGIKAIGYGAVYAASREFYDKHREWGLYTSAGDPLVFIDTFYLMNVAKQSPWRAHMIEQYTRAVSEVGFDGIHMDTYGFPKTAYSYQRQQLIRLEEEYPSLIDDTKKRLEEIKETYLIFNNVGNWPMGAVTNASQTAVYVEVWEPYTSYEQLRQIIWKAKQQCNTSKPVILAAYLEPFRTETMEKAANAAYLLTAAIAANGAYHLLLGEENGVLTQGYYVDYSVLTAEVSSKMRAYYDFLVQYLELLYDDELIDVSMTHMGWDNTEYRCLSDHWSVTAQADKIWVIIREKAQRKVINLLNLCGNAECNWNRGKHTPSCQENITLQVQIDYSVAGVYCSSPDEQQRQVHSLPYSIIKSDRGWVMEFTVLQLSYWTCIWIDFEDTPIC